MIRKINDFPSFGMEDSITLIMNTRFMDIGRFMDYTANKFRYKDKYRLDYSGIRDLFVKAIRATGRKNITVIFPGVPLDNEVQWHFLQEIFDEVSDELKKSGIAFSVELIEDD